MCIRDSPIPEAVPATDSPSHSLNIQNTTTPPEQSPVKSNRFTTFWVWFFFLLSLGICVALVAFSRLETRLPMSKSRILLNPRDIDINLSLIHIWCERRGHIHNLVAEERFISALPHFSFIHTLINTFNL